MMYSSSAAAAVVNDERTPLLPLPQFNIHRQCLGVALDNRDFHRRLMMDGKLVGYHCQHTRC